MVSGKENQLCGDGWLDFQSDCYDINNALAPDLKTWDEARENCSGTNSDLPVIVNEEEKDFVTENSWFHHDIDGYWIGLRAVDGRWKWVDGSDLIESLWAEAPVTGHCVISDDRTGWRSASCDDRNRWICKKKALSV
uniref:natural killer cells antigen CD94-like n=1 Tax=Monopterus albus TaxID=43700 RepID=UPI0009B38164|nr:natural killer cells antigen CD94-like [Monopterus albus]